VPETLYYISNLKTSLPAMLHSILTVIMHNDYLEQLLTPKFALQILSGQCLLADLFLVPGTSPGLPLAHASTDDLEW
jgi:hypothetical protein